MCGRRGVDRWIPQMEQPLLDSVGEAELDVISVLWLELKQ